VNERGVAEQTVIHTQVVVAGDAFHNGQCGVARHPCVAEMSIRLVDRAGVGHRVANRAVTAEAHADEHDVPITTRERCDDVFVQAAKQETLGVIPDVGGARSMAKAKVDSRSPVATRMERMK
jgi:hypothetical protein